MNRLMSRYSALPLLCIGLLAGSRPGPGSTPVAPPEAVQAKLAERSPSAQLTESSAGAAFAFARTKRLRRAGRFHLGRRYLEAREHLATLPRHSTVAGRFAARQPDNADPLATWQSLGPGNIGGRTRAMVIDPERPRIMYLGGVSGGVWKTLDNGRSWFPLDDSMANLAVNSLAMDPADPAVLYAGTGEGYFREAVRRTSLPLRGAGVFKTVDAGTTWERLADTDRGAFRWVNDLVVSHNDSRRVYAATRQGVFRSSDGGSTWSRSLATSVKGGCLDLVIRRDRGADSLFASCGTLAPGSVYRNTDAAGDGTWQRVLSEPGMGRTSLAIAPSRPDTIYALAASNLKGDFEQGLHAIYRSDEDGALGSWSVQLDNQDPVKLNTMLLSNPIVNFLPECGFAGTNEIFNMGWYTNVIAVDPVDAEQVWVGGVDLFRSDDGGRNFQPASTWWTGRGHPGWAHADQHGLVFHPRYDGVGNRRLFVLNDGGIFRTTNAQRSIPPEANAICGTPTVRWTSLANHLGVTQFYHGSVAPGASEFMGGAQDNGTLLGRLATGDRWLRPLGGDGGYSFIDPSDPSLRYATIQGGVVFRSLDGGLTFDEATTGIDDLQIAEDTGFRAVGSRFLFISPLVGDPNEPSRLWLGGSRLWRTDNRAGNWSAASARLPERISSLAVAPGDSDLVVAGGEKGRIFRSVSATSAGPEAAWSAVRPRSGWVSSLAFDPADPGVVYATYATFRGDPLWRSLDGGESWSPIGREGPNRLPTLPVHSVVVDPTDSDRIFLGTDLGVLVSIDGGDSWASENTGFANAVTEWLALEPGSGGRTYLFAFTHGRGVWRAPLD